MIFRIAFVTPEFPTEWTTGGGLSTYLGRMSRTLVLMGHQDRVATLPPNTTELAYSSSCRNQAYRVKDLPIYGTQFHTELSPHTLLERLRLYPKYLPQGTDIHEIEQTLRPTPVAEKIMRRFLELLTEL